MRVSVSAVAFIVASAALQAAERYPTPAETRAEFESVCRRLTEGENAYFGRAVVGRLEERLQEAKEDPLVRFLLRGRLGFELIRLGDLEDAIARLDEAVEFSRSGGAEGDRNYHRLVRSHLATAHLQLAEDQNCVAHHTAASCILPIAAEGVHSLPEHARRAGDVYLELAREDPADYQARWLLNLARMVSGDHPEGVPEALRLPPGALASDAEFARWRDSAPQLGVNAFDLSGGAVMDDFDGDGFLDLISSSWDPCEPLKAFRNDGNGGFEDVSREWGLDGQLGGLNLVHADYDGDGGLDLLVLRGAWLGDEGRIRNSLLRNDLDGETGRFLDVTAAAGLAHPAYPTQTAAWADYDGDGDLDLYVGNEATASSTDPLQLFGQSGNPYPSQLFRNNGNGTFTDVARQAGVDNRRFAKGVAWGDFDDDGPPDLFVSNIGPNRLYRNNGDGTFRDVAEDAGVVEPANGTFTSWFFDYDNDGDLDLFVGPYSTPAPQVFASYFGKPVAEGHAVLYRNDGGRFTDVSEEVGFRRPLLVMGANYGDLDNDGWPDLYLGTGVPDYEALMPNVMYRNDRGRRFQDITFAGGFGHLQKGHGVAFGDLDNDGDQDLFQQLGGAFPFDAYGNALYENPVTDGRWITLRLHGRKANRFGVGARIEVVVEVEDGGRRSVHAVAGSGGSFGGSSMQQEIGLGRAERIDSLVIVWPGSGSRQVYRQVELDRAYEAIEGEPALRPIALHGIRLGEGERNGTHSHSTEP